MFEIQKVRGINTDKLVEGNDYDYVTRTSYNQGVLQTTGKVKGQAINEAGTWSLGLLQMDFFYRKKEWYAGQFVRKIVPKIQLNEEIILFFTAIFNSLKKVLLSVLVRDVDEKFLNMNIELPVKNGNIDYNFMIDLISELEEERISELKNYLKVTGLDNYALNPEEEKAIADFKNLNWGEFNYAELFELLKTKNKLNKMQLDENGKYDVYSAISTNNGIMGKTLVEPEYTVDELIPYYVCFGDHTRKFSIAKSSFSVMDNVKVLKTIETTELKSILFIITTWQKGIKDLGYSRHWKLAKNTKILLPIDSNGNIDYEYMNTLISAIQKEVIKGVVDYADKNIEATKKVVRK